MKCLNMRTPGIVFLLSNLIAIYSIDVRSRTAESEQFSIDKFDKNCPNISKMIRNLNISDYTINCQPYGSEVNEENVLRSACSLAKSLVNLLCESNASQSLIFTKSVNKTLCPFNFSHLTKFGILINNSLVEELTNRDHCSKVCVDLYSKKPQCIVLSSLNNYFRNLNQSVIMSKVEKTTAGVISTTINKKQESENSETVVEKEKSGAIDNLPKIGNPTPKSTPTSIQSELTASGVVNNHTLAHSSVEETKIVNQAQKSTSQLVNNGVVSSEIKKFSSVHPSIEETREESQPPHLVEKQEPLVHEDLPEKYEVTSKNEEPNPEELIDDFAPDTGEMKPDVPPLQVIENSESKYDSSSSSKALYVGEGFFQAEDSHFFFYLIMVSSIIVVGYFAFHNKNKILAYALEGSSGRRNRRRPNPARYRKLETNLEEVISTSTNPAAASSVVY